MPSATWPHDDPPDPAASGLVVGAFAFQTLWLLIAQAILATTGFPYPATLSLEFSAIGLLHYWIARKLWYKARRAPDPILARPHA